MQLEIFDYTNIYPHKAGFKDQETSREAAAKIEASGKAETLRNRCLEAFHTFSATGTEIADYLGEGILSIRPRITELKARGLVEDTGDRRDGEKVWRLRRVN